MDIIENLTNQIDIAVLESCNQFDSSLDNHTIFFMESGESESFIDKLDQSFTAMVEKIKKIIDDAITSIKKFFTEKDIDEAVKKIEKDPAIDKKAKLSYKSNKKAIELSERTIDDLYKASSVKEIEEKMNKYRKQRNKAIATTVIVTVAVAVIAPFAIKKNKEIMDKLKKDKAIAEKNAESSRRTISRLRASINEKDTEIKNLKQDNSDLKKVLEKKPAVQKLRANSVVKLRKVQRSVSDKQEIINTEKAKVAALTEVIGDICKDSANEAKEVVSMITNPKTGNIAKVGSVVKGVGNVVSNVGETTKNMNKENASKLRETLKEKNQKGRDLNEKYKRAKKKLETMKKGTPEYDKLSKSISAAYKELGKLADESRTLKKAINDLESK